MKRAVIVVSLVTLAAVPHAETVAYESHNVRLLAHLDPYGTNSSCWSYVHHDGREYAVVGIVNGTSIVDLTHPDSPREISFIPGLYSEWREAKQYRDWVYISTEAQGGGIQIVRMSDPEHPVLVKTYTTDFDALHTLQIDTTRALLYANGASLGGVEQGMFVLSLEDPENPSLLAPYWYDGNHYVHDSCIRGDRLYIASGYSGWLREFSMADPYNPREERAWSYPGYSFTHSIELSRDGRYAYVCDEAERQPLRIFDMQPSGTPILAATLEPPPGVFFHQWHVKQDTALVAAYAGGVRLYDLSDPTHPAEYGFLDTYAAPRSGFNGVWETVSLPSGIGIASDIQSGLFVFQPVPDYGVVRVHALDASGAPRSGIDVVRVGTRDSLQTGADGIAVMATEPGTFDVSVRGPDFLTTTVRMILRRGAHEELVVRSEPARAVFTLDPVMPNPARGAVRMSLWLRGSDAKPVKITIHDARGRLVATLVDGIAAPGRVLAAWDGRDRRGSPAPSGVYWARAESRGEIASKRFARIR